MICGGDFGSGVATDPSFASVKFLSGFEGANGQTTFTDESLSARAITRNSTAQVSTAQFKYGTSALLLNGTSDYLSCADSADFEFGSGEFTVEMFVYFTSVANATFCGHRDGSGNGWRFGRNSGALRFEGDNGVGTIGSVWTPTTNTWYHVCADRASNGDVRTYLDGVMLQKATPGANSMTAHSGTFTIGRNPSSGAFFFPGYIDELRITKGVGRYVSDSGFTVPAAAYPRS